MMEKRLLWHKTYGTWKILTASTIWDCKEETKKSEGQDGLKMNIETMRKVSKVVQCHQTYLIASSDDEVSLGLDQDNASTIVCNVILHKINNAILQYHDCPHDCIVYLHIGIMLLCDDLGGLKAVPKAHANHSRLSQNSMLRNAYVRRESWRRSMPNAR